MWIPNATGVDRLDTLGTLDRRGVPPVPMIFPNPAKDDLFDRDMIVEDAQIHHASAGVNWHTIAKALDSPNERFGLLSPFDQ